MEYRKSKEILAPKIIFSMVFRKTNPNQLIMVSLSYFSPIFKCSIALLVIYYTPSQLQSALNCG